VIGFASLFLIIGNRLQVDFPEVRQVYLKQLEIVGFKTFANKTRLTFEPGMTAIVGPNGCGKSNVCDAIRWVLGEQRARVLRGTKMEDIIFNGTDSQKPLGMAEVTITLADCSEALGVEFDEVSVTRRVFRSGESSYFINRKACRLKDIQRLFMGTGIGTEAYSILEQGKIDQILSSRPEDRRTVFEEVSGITKYKADKKEALRKLEHTEANLLRLADVIREVKRQIISLQRQAGKARRYKALSEEVRTLDIYVTREKIKEFQQKIAQLDTSLAEFDSAVNELHQQTQKTERETEEARQMLSRLEESISRALDETSAARSELERTHNLININKERIAEFTNLAEQGVKEAETASQQLENNRQLLNKIHTQMETAIKEKEEARIRLEQATRNQNQVDNELNEARAKLNNLRNESIAIDSRISRLQNQLNELDARERSSILRKERLATEKDELERSLASYIDRKQEMDRKVEILSAKVAKQSQKLNELISRRSSSSELLAKKEKDLVETQKIIAAKQAQEEILSSGENRKEGFPAGAKLLLDPPADLPLDRSGIIGPLAELLKTEPEYQTALEAILRPCIDAIAVRDEAFAREVLAYLREQDVGSARLLSVHLSGREAPTDFSSPIGIPLLDCITYDDSIKPLIHRLFWNVRLVGSEVEIPEILSADTVIVTLTGTVVSGDGSSELWMPDAEDKSPLARHQMRENLKKEIAALEAEIQQQEADIKTLRSEASGIGTLISNAQQALEESRRELALQEGERQVITRETKKAQERVETVTFEFNSLCERESKSAELRSHLASELQETRDRQATIRKAVAEVTKAMTDIEERRSNALAQTSEHRMVYTEKKQILENLISRKKPQEERIHQLEELIHNRSAGIDSYKRRIKELETSINEAQEKIQPLENQLKKAEDSLTAQRAKREETVRLLNATENRLHTLRETLEKKLNCKSSLEVERAEYKMRCDNAVERILSTYHITLEEMNTTEPPRWENDEIPPREVIETRVAEIQAKLDSMGPVNLVAIEEHAELEERFAFLNKQQDDLLAAKQQLLDMIKMINKTTTEMFQETFNKVNENFQNMFKKLFGGGSAKLVLIDDEDVLESGIEIIARPPGKKLQSISLLSGGERTMTAVALLFSLFLVKPSPFCVLDELDAALDEANIGRFVETLKGFLSRSQFLVITHNRQTIAAADSIYGVTMEVRGISKVVSMKFSDYQDREKELTA